jgi:SAM-dependent methyltransferase
MDLRERATWHGRRHPWEISRVLALNGILEELEIDADTRILDVGCGDGYAAHHLLKEMSTRRVVGLDIHLEAHEIAVLERSRADRRQIYFNRWEDLRGERFDLILLLDVVEHVEDDVGFLARIVDDHLTRGGHLLMTVPAFQWLFSAHDRFLKHQRRYSLKRLRALVQQVGLSACADGYLFSSLLVLRALSILKQRLQGREVEAKGLGSWRHGALISKPVELALRTDNRVMLFLHRLGVTLPGLTAWTLCRG